MAKIVGIDLGTTNSLVAVWENGSSKLIPNAFGEYLTPSVVSVDDDGMIYVGKTAQERLASYPDKTASVFKRFMGTSKKYYLGGKEFRPEELSALVLKKLKEDAERYLGEQVEEAVISVPAYFNDMARNATKRAGQIAGFRVERIINEPSAAALACQNINREEDATVLVYDFGGGTLDVSLVECFDNIIEIKAVSGDNHLGGKDFDDVISAYFINECQIPLEEITAESKALVRAAAEKCKKELTEKKEAEMTVNCEQFHKKLVITRKDVVRIGAELFDRMGKPIKRVLSDGGMTVDRLDQVVLVGGSCKMPLVQQYLRHILGREDVETVNPDHMVALGVGVYAGIKERDEDVKDMLLTDICPFSLGIGIHNENEPGRNLTSFIIERNSPLPISREHSYCTVRDNQRVLRFEICQGEEMYAEDNISLGQLEIEVPPGPKGYISANVRFTYDMNGVLEVNVYIPFTQKSKQLVIVNKELGMSTEQIKEKLREFEKFKINPYDDEENQYVLEWAKRLFTQCNSYYRDEIERRMHYFIHIMDVDQYQIPKVRKYFTVFLAMVEQMNDKGISMMEEDTQDGSWYEEDEDDQEIEKLFREWESEENGENHDRD